MFYYTNEFILIWFRFGLWYLTPLSTIFQLYRGNNFFWKIYTIAKQTIIV